MNPFETPNAVPQHALIFGASSLLGRTLVPRLAEAGVSRFHLTHHSRPAPDVQAGSDPVWHRCDVTAEGAPEAVIDIALSAAAAACAQLLVVYCCGLWRAGKYRTLAHDQLRAAWAVGVDAPHRVACWLSRNPERVGRFVLVSGLGGAANHITGNSIYAMVCDSARALVTTLDAEARERAGTFAAHGVQIGLVDKGQPWIDAFIYASGQRPAPNFNEAADLIVEIARGALPGTRGTSVVLQGEMTSYAHLLAFHAGRDTHQNAAGPRTPT